MAKDKNHSSKNQNHKNHQNGIKKPRRQKYASLQGVNQKFLRNRRRAVRNDPNITRPKSLQKRVEAFKARTAWLLLTIEFKNFFSPFSKTTAKILTFLTINYFALWIKLIYLSSILLTFWIWISIFKLFITTNLFNFTAICFLTKLAGLLKLTLVFRTYFYECHNKYLVICLSIHIPSFIYSLLTAKFWLIN